MDPKQSSREEYDNETDHSCKAARHDTVLRTFLLSERGIPASSIPLSSYTLLVKMRRRSGPRRTEAGLTNEMIGDYTDIRNLAGGLQMPIYEYECLDCGKVFEIFQKISDEPLKECRECKGRVNRLISLCSFQLKGTGWYVTDYKSSASSASGNGSQRGDKKESKSEEKSETKTETKPETKTETAKSESTGGAT